MCQQVRCRRCNGVTWTGCGQHVNQVMRGVSPGERCTCEATGGGSSSSSGKGLLSRLFGR